MSLSTVVISLDSCALLVLFLLLDLYLLYASLRYVYFFFLFYALCFLFSNHVNRPQGLLRSMLEVFERGISLHFVFLYFYLFDSFLSGNYELLLCDTLCLVLLYFDMRSAHSVRSRLVLRGITAITRLLRKTPSDTLPYSGVWSS